MLTSISLQLKMKSDNMIGIAMYTTILTLYKQGMSQRKIAKTINTHRSTVNKIIKKYESSKIEVPIPYQRSSLTGSWHEEIIDLMSKRLSTVRIYEQLQDNGYGASYSSLSRYIRKHNIKQNTCIRFHTEAGQEAQVDFGDIGRRLDDKGKLRKSYVFNMRLSYSRFDYYEVVFDQRVETWTQCHINAFRYFGGVPKVIKLDNLKAGVLNANFYEPIYQKEYKRMADHYGCLLSACRPYQPQEKGKVESGIKYVKNNFFAGREFVSNAEMNQQLGNWLVRANNRIHGTTKVKPAELFADKELVCLFKLPSAEFNISSWHSRMVAKDCHISLENNYYSVPSKYVAKEVAISLTPKIVKIYSGESLIATHARAKGVGIFTTNTNHYDKYKSLCPGSTDHDEKCKTSMVKMGSNCALMLSYIKQEQKNDWYRAVKGIINLRKYYSDEIIDKACLRALHYGISSYSKIKRILESNCYDLPLNDSNGGGMYAKFN
ncbi:MAG: IS21 family transposase [Gammaproteobacteria bacterium]|nr:IS21 family transposase [Gammaproteobacteria bacterium]